MTTHYNEGNGMKTASHGCRMRAAACQGSVLDTNTHFGDAEICTAYSMPCVSTAATTSGAAVSAQAPAAAVPAAAARGYSIDSHALTRASAHQAGMYAPTCWCDNTSNPGSSCSAALMARPALKGFSQTPSCWAWALAPSREAIRR